jgi:hypothetical protein
VIGNCKGRHELRWDPERIANHDRLVLLDCVFNKATSDRAVVVGGSYLFVPKND